MACGGLWHNGLPFANQDMMAETLASGASPLFYPHKIEGSTFSHGLLMSPPLDGEEAAADYDPVGEEPAPAITVFTEDQPRATLVVGTGSLSWAEGPGIVEPCEPHVDGPGPLIPKHPKLCLPFGLPTASLYTNPGNPADLLPLVYGDFRVGGLRGPVPATLIDRGDPALGSVGPWTYCGAWMPVVSVENVYIEDVEQSFSLDTVNPNANIVVSLSNNFQNVGPIM